jgi:hypothetical protein
MSFLKYYQGANPGKKRKNANPSEEIKSCSSKNMKSAGLIVSFLINGW